MNNLVDTTYRVVDLLPDQEVVVLHDLVDATECVVAFGAGEGRR